MRANDINAGYFRPSARRRPAPSKMFAIFVFATFGFGTCAGGATLQQKQAISATVTGNDQQVGFRAMVMKQAIECNLAGSAKNDQDEIVRFTLQGDAGRIDAAVAAIREGTKKSSDIKVSTTATAVDPALSTFTVIDWTSTSRNITTPYTLVFALRGDDSVVSKSDAKSVWHNILKTTLKGDDLKKLGDDD
jgi:acylphosphatase